MNSYENKPPYYCLNYILSLWIRIVYLFVVFRPFSMRLKQRSRWRMEGKRGRGACCPPHIEHFPVDSVEGFSAAWLNEQRHANEWRTNVIIYQTKSGGLWEMETGGGGGRKGPTLLKIFRKDLPSNSYLKLVPCSHPSRFFSQALYC